MSDFLNSCATVNVHMKHHHHDAWFLSLGERHPPRLKHKLIDLSATPFPNQQPRRPLNSFFPLDHGVLGIRENGISNCENGIGE